MRISSERCLLGRAGPTEQALPLTKHLSNPPVSHKRARKARGGYPAAEAERRRRAPPPRVRKIPATKRSTRCPENREEGGRRRRDQEDNGQDSSRPAVLHSSPRELLRPPADDMVQPDDHEREGQLRVHPMVQDQEVARIHPETYGATHEGDHERRYCEAFVDGEG